MPDLGYLLTLPQFDHLEAKSVDEACSLLDRYKDKARVIAGGTDLLVLMKKRRISPQYLINIKTIPNLDYIHFSEQGGLTIGAMASLQSVANSDTVKDKFGLLATACNKIGTPQVRNMGTIGGNIASAVPSADIPPALIAAGAFVLIRGKDGERKIPLDQFFLGPLKTVLKNRRSDLQGYVSLHMLNIVPSSQ